MNTLSFTTSGAAVSSTVGWSCMLVSHTTLPVSLFVPMTREGHPATEITRLPHNATPRFDHDGGFSSPGSMRHTMRPASPERASIL